MKRILVIRFSALGDVAMAVPVVQALAQQHPDLDITFLSKRMCAPLFARMPQNVHFVGIEPQALQSFGNLKAFVVNELNIKQFDYVADLHSVLRSFYIKWRAWLHGAKIATIDKGHPAKRRLTRAHCKRLVPLKNSTERYADVLQRLGLAVTLDFTSLFATKPASRHWVGFAPFARHKGKIYPTEKSEKVVELLSQRGWTVYLFGNGEREKTLLESWAAKHPNVVCTAGKSTLQDELELMNALDVMVSMDSANMHLASLAATPVVSVWGATHPYAGFMGWHQSMDNAVQLDLPCRPCSTFGNKPCRYSDYRCLTGIAPEMIVEKVEKIAQ